MRVQIFYEFDYLVGATFRGMTFDKELSRGFDFFFGVNFYTLL